MHFDEDLVDKFEFCNGKVFEDLPFAAFAVDLQSNMFVEKVVTAHKLVQCKCVAGDFVPQADIEEVVAAVVGGTAGAISIVAVELVVRNAVFGGQVAAEGIEAVDADVDQSFGLFKKIVAGDISPVVRDTEWIVGPVIVSAKIAISVLPRWKGTL